MPRPRGRDWASTETQQTEESELFGATTSTNEWDGFKENEMEESGQQMPKRTFFEHLLRLNFDYLKFNTSECIQRRLTHWKEGWTRIMNILPPHINLKLFVREIRPETLEWKVLKFGFYTSVVVGLLTGGLASFADSSQRFDIYATGKTFGSVTIYKMKRKQSYIIWRFYSQGFLKGFSLSTILCSVIWLTVAITAFRDRYSYLHFPVSSTLVLSFVAYRRALGIYGLFASFGFTAFITLLMHSSTWVACKIAGFDSVADGYKHLQKLHWEEDVRSAKERTELRRYMREKGIYFKLIGRWKMEKEKRLGIWRGANREAAREDELLKFAALGDEFDETNHLKCQE